MLKVITIDLHIHNSTQSIYFDAENQIIIINLKNSNLICFEQFSFVFDF